MNRLEEEFNAFMEPDRPVLSRRISPHIEFVIRSDEVIFDFGIANFRIHYYFSKFNLEFKYPHLKLNYGNYSTKTVLDSLTMQNFGIYFDLSTALFGKDSNEVILSILSAAIKYLSNLNTRELDLMDKINNIFLLLWNFLPLLPKHREKRLISESVFFFEIFRYFHIPNCDVKINAQPKYDNEFYHPNRSFDLIIQNSNEDFYRRCRTPELYDLIKSVFFSDEHLTVENVYWGLQDFEITVKFDNPPVGD